MRSNRRPTKRLGDRVIEISFEASVEPPVLTVIEKMPYPLATVWVAETELG